MVLLALTFLASGEWTTTEAAQARTSGTTQSQEDRVSEFYDQARAIIRENQNLELSLEEARRRVNKLHKDIVSWSETVDVELTHR